MSALIQAANQAPPHSDEAERGLLASILLDPEALDEVSLIVGVDDFYRVRHREIFNACIEVSGEGAPVTLLTVRDRLARLGKLESVGGAPALADIAGEYAPSPATEYAKIVARERERRKLLNAGSEIMRLARDGELTVREATEEAERLIYALGENGAERKSAPLGSDLKAAMARVGKSRAGGLKLGWRSLDRMTGGFRPGQLIIVGGRPSMGKTTLGLAWAASMARAGCKVALFSAEMTRRELAENLVCQASGFSSVLYSDSPEVDTAVCRDVASAVAPLCKADFHVCDSIVKIEGIRSECRRVKRRSGLDVVFVDYIQLIAAPRGIEKNRRIEIETVSRELKALAKEISVPVVVLCQLNRQVEGREKHEPRLSDIREAGGIEQDADLVLLLHRPSYYTDRAPKGEGALIVAKNRSGPCGKIPLYFDLTKFRIAESYPQTAHGALRGGLDKIEV